MKWLWRYNGEDQTFWREVIQCKYGQTNHRCTNIVSNNYGVGVWRSVRASWPTLSENICYKVGNGRRILFWRDDWNGQEPLMDFFLVLFSVCHWMSIGLLTYGTSPLEDTWMIEKWGEWVASWNFFRTWHNQVKRRKMDLYQLKGPIKGN